MHRLPLSSYAQSDTIRHSTNRLKGGTDVKRHKMGNHQSRKLFTRTARTHHPKNTSPPPMRGGIRM